MSPKVAKKTAVRSAKVNAPPREIGLDGAALRRALTALTKDMSGNDIKLRNGALNVLRARLSEALADIRDRFEAGDLGGIETARHISLAHENLLSALYDFVTIHVFPLSNPTDVERLAVSAVGGFGRGEMAPHSDLDLLFLRSDKILSAWAESVTEYMLYMLWDLGLKVGQSSRSIAECLKLAKEDQTILTSLLDGRHLCGDETLTSELRVKFRKFIKKGTSRGFIATKLEERDSRHKRFGNSRYVLEPNVKEGKGGLRDLHSLYWIASYLAPKGLEVQSPQSTKAYQQMGLFRPDAARRFARAADFLWRTRCHLHYLAGRPIETLSFDRQGEIAGRMGHAKPRVEDAVEGFMREYFLNAREVGALTRIACARLEEDAALKFPIGLDQLVPRIRGRLQDPALARARGRIIFKDPYQLNDDPSLILKLFKEAGRLNLDIHPDALAAITARRNLIDADFRKDKDNAQIFFDILLKSQTPARVLGLMNEAGVLGRYVLEFGHIVARTQFNMHHAYTVDEHTLGLIDNLGKIEAEVKNGDREPLAFMAHWDEATRQTLYLAALLHDTGKGKGDQCIAGAKQARKACRRMSVSAEQTELVSWLVRHHLDMSETAQRRDISDPETIAGFAATVGTQARLELLLVLTIIDIQAVGPGIWNDWKGRLLLDLFKYTSAYLDTSGEGLSLEARVRDAKQACYDRLPEKNIDLVRPWLDGFKPTYWLGFSTTNHLRHARFAARNLGEGNTHAVHYRQKRRQDISEIWVMTRDRSGLFADMAAAITHLGASIKGARLHTTPKGDVFDVFYLQDAENLAFASRNEAKAEQLKADVLAAASGTSEILPPNQIGYRSKRAAAIPVTESIRFSGEARGRVQVVEIECRDRPGLLYGLAQALTDAGASILTAHIDVEGERAVDTFYIVPAGRKDGFTDADRDAINAALAQAISDGA